MYPIPQAGDFDSQAMLNLQYDHVFSDTSLHHTQSADYMNTSRRSSMDVYGTSGDMSVALNYSYPPVPCDYVETQTQVHLHAPVPVPTIPYCSPHAVNSSRNHPSPYVEQGYEGTNNSHTSYSQAISLATSSTTTDTSILDSDYFTNSAQLLFPTPSELLKNISAASTPIFSTLPSSLAHPTQRAHSQSSEHIIGTPASTTPAPKTVNKAESQRKARQRAIAEEIGFIPTDPDTISSHEKKRHYLECLEHYVSYLHDQLHLVNTAPLALERVSTYRGLSSRSIRTLLVHMQNTNRRLHENTLREEQVFLNLSAEVMNTHGIPTRRHSVDTTGQSTDSHASPFADCGATRDGERAFLSFCMASSGVDQPQVASNNILQGHFDIHR